MVPLPSALLDWSALPEDEALSAEAQEALRAAITELPPGLRTAFVLLRDVEGLSTADCAQVQGLSEGARRYACIERGWRCASACRPLSCSVPCRDTTHAVAQGTR